MSGKYISLDEIAGRRGIENYSQLAEYIYNQIEMGCLKPVKSHGINGKKPALYKDYHILEKKPDYFDSLEEIQYQLSSRIDVSYYLAHPEQYLKERKEVLVLSRYLDQEQETVF